MGVLFEHFPVFTPPRDPSQSGPQFESSPRCLDRMRWSSARRTTTCAEARDRKSSPRGFPTPGRRFLATSFACYFVPSSLFLESLGRVIAGRPRLSLPFGAFALMACCVASLAALFSALFPYSVLMRIRFVCSCVSCGLFYGRQHNKRVMKGPPGRTHVPRCY